MIRRGFWLATGAIVGVTGYRKAARLARSLTGQADARRPAAVLVPGARTVVAGRPRLRPPGRNGAGREAGARSGVATAVARAASAAGFVRDVREGMAEYWDLHRGESDPTLESRSDRISPVERQQGRIES